MFAPHRVDIAFPWLCLAIVSRVPRFARFGEKSAIEKPRHVLGHLCGCVWDQLWSFVTAYTCVSTTGWSARRCLLRPVGWVGRVIRRVGYVGCIVVGLGAPGETSIDLLIAVSFDLGVIYNQNGNGYRTSFLMPTIILRYSIKPLYSDHVP